MFNVQDSGSAGPFTGKGIFTIGDPHYVGDLRGKVDWIGVKVGGGDGANDDQIARFKKTYPEIKLVIWQGQPDMEGVAAVKRHGADGYIAQGENPAEMSAAMAVASSVNVPKAVITHDANMLNFYDKNSGYGFMWEYYKNEDGGKNPTNTPGTLVTAVEKGAPFVSLTLGSWASQKKPIGYQEYLADIKEMESKGIQLTGLSVYIYNNMNEEQKRDFRSFIEKYTPPAPPGAVTPPATPPTTPPATPTGSTPTGSSLPPQTPAGNPTPPVGKPEPTPPRRPAGSSPGDQNQRTPANSSAAYVGATQNDYGKMARQAYGVVPTPDPYTGGAGGAEWVNQKEHSVVMQDGSRRTITETGAVIRRKADGSAYREGWIDPEKIDNYSLKELKNLDKDNLRYGSTNPWANRTNEARPSKDATTVDLPTDDAITGQASVVTDSSAQNGTPNSTPVNVSQTEEEPTRGATPTLPAWHTNPNWTSPDDAEVVAAGLDPNSVLEQRPGQDGKTIFRLSDGTYQAYDSSSGDTSPAGNWDNTAWNASQYAAETGRTIETEASNSDETNQSAAEATTAGYDDSWLYGHTAQPQASVETETQSSEATSQSGHYDDSWMYGHHEPQAAKPQFEPAAEPGQVMEAGSSEITDPVTKNEADAQYFGEMHGLSQEQIQQLTDILNSGITI